MLDEVLARINLRLEKVGLSESAAARQAGLSADAIRNMRRSVEQGKRAGASTRTLSALAPVLQTTVAWLTEQAGPEEAAEAGASMPIAAPLISWVSAGALLKPDVPVDFEGAPILLEPGLDPNGDWIALRVDGDSMDRISPHDSVIFVNRRERRLVPNACYVIGDGDGGATYKRYRPPNTWEPVSTNPAHKPFVLKRGSEPDIIGRVRKTVLSM